MNPGYICAVYKLLPGHLPPSDRYCGPHLNASGTVLDVARFKSTARQLLKILTFTTPSWNRGMNPPTDSVPSNSVNRYKAFSVFAHLK